MHRRGIGAAFEIGLAEWTAADGPAFLAPIGGEAVAHQQRLHARITQHRVAMGFAAVKIGKVVGLEYRSATLDVCVVAVHILAGDQEVAGIVLWVSAIAARTFA